jgi:hypothetical protein
MAVLRIVALILWLPAAATAQSYVAGYGGILHRLQTGSFDFPTFRSGPTSLTSAAGGAGGGTRIWKVDVDASILFLKTGQTNVIIAPTRQIEVSSSGHAVLMEAGGGWPLIRIAGFQTGARAGYGLARVRVPTEIPIEDDRRFWTYGLYASRPFRSHFVLRVDARNVHFHPDEFPLTLGRYNVVVLGGFGLKF